MTQFFTEDGLAYPATIISAGPITLVSKKTKEKDGYEALRFGFETKKESRLNKAQKGEYKELGNFAVVREVKPKTGSGDLESGLVIDVDAFTPNDRVSVTGISKSKGFQGVVKRHGFHGGRRSHGQKHSEREAGSIGGGGRAGGRVAKGMRMAGRMGGDTITVKNLRVLAIDKEANLILIKGAIPGRSGTLVEIRGN